MKLSIWLLASVFGICAARLVSAAPPPLDRPSPPPCCADGLCYPNPLTWGHYPTKWRRWPTDYLEPLPPEALPPAPLDPDVPAFEAPPAEEEDRRAPPPTAPRVPPEGEDQAPAPPSRGPATGAPPTVPITPPQPPAAFPWDEDRGEEDAPASEFRLDSEPPPTTRPFGGEPPSSLQFDEPMGQLDPPPAPPFVSPSAKGRAPAARAAVAPGAGPSQGRAGGARPDDPPPAMPIAMAR